MFHLARVWKVLPERHGVLVVFRDGTFTAEGDATFVRVLAKRAHPVFGASICLPEEGEQGVVAELDGGLLVWLGGVHYREANQVDPTLCQDADIHTSGVIRRTGPNGDFEVLHPSGFRMTISQDGNAMAPLQRTSSGPAALAPNPHATLSHPSGGYVTIDPDGNLDLGGFASLDAELPNGSSVKVDAEGNLAAGGFQTVDLELPNKSSLKVDVNGNLTMAGFNSFTFTLPGGGELAVDSSGNLELKGLASINFQNGANRFVMDTILAWLSGHTHSNGNNGANTGAPNQASGLTPAAMCSPAKFTGPQGA